jgi:hypothetical protein
MSEWETQTERINRLALQIHPRCRVVYEPQYRPKEITCRIISSKHEILCEFLRPTLIEEIRRMTDEAICYRIIEQSAILRDALAWEGKNPKRWSELSVIGESAASWDCAENVPLLQQQRAGEPTTTDNI